VQAQVGHLVATSDGHQVVDLAGRRYPLAIRGKETLAVASLAEQAAKVAQRREDLVRAGAGPTPGDGFAQYCLAVVEELVQLRFPAGIVTGRVRDDDVNGAGTLTRRYLGVPSREWTPVTDWQALADSVAAAGAGAAAFVMINRPGRIGHALALVATRHDGVLMVDPDMPGHATTSVVLPPMPFNRTRAGLTRLDKVRNKYPLVEARALIVDPEGRTAAPASTSTASLSGTVRAITDAAHRPIGAIGFEAELRPMVMLRQEFTDAAELVSDFQITARDGTFKVVLDKTGAYMATDRTFYRSRINLEQAGKQMAGTRATWWSILEIVTEPMKVLPGEDDKQGEEGVFAAIRSILSRIDIREETPIEDIFPIEDFSYSGDAKGAFLLPDPTEDAVSKLHLHYTVGVSLESGMSFLVYLRRRMPSLDKRRLSDGIRFAEEMVSRYLGSDYVPATAGLLDARDVSMLRFFLAVVYTQVAAVLPPGPHDQPLIKNRTGIALRTDLAAWRRELPQPVQDFLKTNVTEMRAALVRTARAEKPELPVGVLGLRTLDESEATIGDYLDNALLPVSSAQIIDQDKALGVDTHFAELDTAGGRLQAPLVLLELRYFGAYANTLQEVHTTFTALKRQAREGYESARAIRQPAHNHPRRIAGRQQLAKRLSESTDPVVRDTLHALAGVDPADPRLTPPEREVILLELGKYLHSPDRNAEHLMGALEQVVGIIHPPHPEPGVPEPAVEHILRRVIDRLRSRVAVTPFGQQYGGHQPGNFAQVWNVDTSDAMIRGLESIVDIDPDQRATVAATLKTWIRGERTTGRADDDAGDFRPTSQLSTAADLKWVTPSISSHDADGTEIPEEDRRCVSVAVVTLAKGHGGRARA
jgi:hypothetical protein